MPKPANTSPPHEPSSQRAHAPALLWFAFFGGSFAWTLHLLGAYLIAEFGCLSNTGQTRHLGIAGLTWSLAILSIFMFSLAAAASVVGRFALRRLQRNRPAEVNEQGTMNVEEDVHRSSDTRIHLARAGAVMSGIFALAILCQTVPIFFYLRGC